MIKLKGKHFGAQGSVSTSSNRALGSNVKQQKIIVKEKDNFSSESASNSPTLSNMPITVDLEPVLYGIAENPVANRTTFNRLYKDMYYYDAVCGSAVDLYSSLPFSEFTLGGITDKEVASIFYENIERLNIRTLLNELSIDYLVSGAFLGSLLYNKEQKLFFDIMPHDIGNADITPLPFYSQDPIINMKFPPEISLALNAKSPRIDKIKEKLGPAVVEKLLSGTLELDPLGTIYLPRKTFTSSEGTSFFKRVLPIYLIEKNLFRGTLIESAKRQRGILHITVGDGDQWEPTQADMEAITDLFMNADADPLGAVITTRLGISTEELRQGGDFWKWTDIVDQTTAMKLKAMGISEGFLAGDATMNCVIGTTLIPTSSGLQRIGSICDIKRGNLQSVNFEVGSRYGKEKASKWLYSGEHPTICVTAESGNSVTGTHKHRLLVLRDNSLEWIYLKDIRLYDYLCINPVSALRSQDYVIRTLGMKVDTKLSYLIGCLVKRGYLADGCIKILLPDTIAKRFCEYFSQTFYPIETIDHKNANKQLIVIEKEYVVKLFNSLIGNKTSLPWCIAKTSSESQLSFIAALVDLSSINKIVFEAASFGKELLCLMNALGVMCDLKFNHISMPDGEDFILYEKIKHLCVLEHEAVETDREWYGVPQDDIIVPYSKCDNCSEALDKPYRFVKVVSIKDAGVQKVYDLSVNENNPSYIANGLVSHNTMETSLTVFIEQLRAYRDRITRKLLYNKVFPLISMVNGYTVTKAGKLVKQNRILDVEDALETLQDGSKLFIPVVHWNKQLKPEGDSTYLDLLDRMTAAGVPVPLRAMAAAGGFNLDEILSQQEDDISLREKMKAYVDRLAKFKTAPEGEESGGFGSESSVLESELKLLDASPEGKHFSAILSSGGRKSLFKRKFDPEIVGQTKTGKKKLILDQVSANKRANNGIVKAVKQIAKHKKTPLTHTTTTQKKEKREP